MADKIPATQRSANMRAIQSSRTKLENKVCQYLWNAGLRFRRNVKELPGKPDIAIKKYKIVIFIDSCFWHCCPEHGHIPKSNTEYWVKKFERNQSKDREISLFYSLQGWNIIRVWSMT